ncbi:MAG: flavin reductase family protein [Candidatus Hermodarchaeota archaeon]
MMINMEEERTEIGPYDFINYFMSRAAHVVSRDKNGHLNVMALLWKTIGELWMIPVITIAVAPTRYTFTLLKEGVQEFTLNIPSKKNAETINITGSLSGRNTDKFKKAHLVPIEGQRTKVPTIKDSILCYECKVVHSCKSGSMASHHLFFGQILTAYASNELFNSSFVGNR